MGQGAGFALSQSVLCNFYASGSLEDKQFQPKETLVFIRLVKYALQALDIYTLQITSLSHAQTRNAA